MPFNQHAELIWTPQNTPISTRFDDPYFSLNDALAETRHVFLDGNDLPARFFSCFHIGELGFGSGLNALSAWVEWQKSGLKGTLKFTSFEAFSLRPDERERALSSFPELKQHAKQLCTSLAKNPTSFETDDFHLQIILGDARAHLGKWHCKADAWFLDGFAPAKNPELWERALLKKVADHTALGGTFATYSAAGHIRRALSDAGFNVTRCTGFARKRHMSRGVLQ